MPAPKTLPEPSTADPLAHATLGLRLHAAYLRAGYNRRQFVAAIREANPSLKTHYGTVMQWESGSTPELAALATAAQLVGYTMDELFHGRMRRAPKAVAAYSPPKTRRTPESKLDDAGIVAALDAIEATDEQREALGEYTQSPAGKFASYTRTFVVTFCAAYATSLEKGRAHPQAIIEAAREARSMRALEATTALGGTTPTVGELAKIGSEVRAIVRKSRVVKRKR